MKFEVTSMNNFCRVFQLPDSFSGDYCFGGPIPHLFQMVDWFNPIPVFPPGMADGWPSAYPFEVELQKVHDHLVPWLLKKPYVRAGHTYLILFDFGASLTFKAKDQE